MRNYKQYLLVVLILIAFLLLWIGVSRYNDFRDYHKAIAIESSESVAASISAFIEERRRLVALFARENSAQIDHFALNPDDAEQHDSLLKRIKEYFPDVFAFTVSNLEGEPYYDDFEGTVGELCQQEIRRHARGEQSRPRIHPHELAYHFDIMTTYEAEQGKKILFISFHADLLGKVLKHSQTIGHQLMLIYPDASNLIEVTSEGARINWARNDYRLSEDELSRVLHTAQVEGTVWQTMDFIDQGLFDDYLIKVVRNSSIVMFAFMLVSFMMYQMIRREEAARREAESAKDNFLSVVSHELRTPLTSINGSLNLIYNGIAGEVGEEIKKLLAIAINNGDRLGLLIDDLLDLQKIEAGKMEFDFKQLDLVALVKDAIKNNHAYGEKYGASFHTESYEESAMVLGDAMRLHQVMANLLSNAAKYGADQDEILVTIIKNEQSITVSVIDHGEGVPESFQNQIFNRFAQGAQANTRKVGGTGLGLNIVKLIIEKLDGEVGFESQTGKGARFFFTLPLAK